MAEDFEHGFVEFPSGVGAWMGARRVDGRGDACTNGRADGSAAHGWGADEKGRCDHPCNAHPGSGSWSQGRSSQERGHAGVPRAVDAHLTLLIE
jgi:hypothetical protein